MPQTQNTFYVINQLLFNLWENNVFYREKWQAAGISRRQLSSLSDLCLLPLTTRNEIAKSQYCQPPYGTNLTFPLTKYRCAHYSSGSTGHALIWPDDPTGWQWVLQGSKSLYELADVNSFDRILLAHFDQKLMSTASLYEGAMKLGCNDVSGTQGTDAEKVACLVRSQPSVIVGKARELIMLGEAALQHCIDPGKLGVRKLIAGGCGPGTNSTRERLNRIWNSQVFDRYGMAEAGPIAAECLAHSGMHLRADALIAEVIDPKTTSILPEGARGELVLTTLGRYGSPLIRYRTGDHVQILQSHHCSCGRTEPLLVGGVQRVARSGFA